MKKYVLIVDDTRGYCYAPFKHLGLLCSDPTILAKTPDKVALVVFTGGEDVSPSIYNEKPHKSTCSNLTRDIRESKVFDYACKLRIPIFGICRGAQLVCALSGGKLVQHISGHGRNNSMTTNKGEIFVVTSTHHQMQLPPKDAEVIGWAMPRLSTCYYGAEKEYTPEMEYEVVYYPNTNAIGMQYHPEFMDANNRGFQFCGEIIQKYLGKVYV